jgi:hypothetical protein
MTKVTYPNGVTLQYDETIKIGDIISAYQAGYHKVVEIQEREGSTPFIHYVRVANQNWMPAESKKFSCDASYCIHAQDTLVREILVRQKQLDSLKSFLNSI